MSAASHARGPWVVDDDTLEVVTAESVRFTLTKGGIALIAQVYPHNGCESFSGLANARLIAAAPELLAALRAMLDTFGVFEHPHDDGEDGEFSAIGTARAAIARATGGAA